MDMKRIYSSRAIEQACKENINFMFLLEGNKAPDHNTIARFRSKHFTVVKDQLMEELVKILIEQGEISLANVFIDGTKIEAYANRCTFVWKKWVLKSKEKLQEKIKKELPGLCTLALNARDVHSKKSVSRAEANSHWRSEIRRCMFLSVLLNNAKEWKYL